MNSRDDQKPSLWMASESFLKSEHAFRNMREEDNNARRVSSPMPSMLTLSGVESVELRRAGHSPELRARHSRAAREFPITRSRCWASTSRGDRWWRRGAAFDIDRRTACESAARPVFMRARTAAERWPVAPSGTPVARASPPKGLRSGIPSCLLSWSNVSKGWLMNDGAGTGFLHVNAFFCVFFYFVEEERGPGKAGEEGGKKNVHFLKKGNATFKRSS